MRRNVTLVAAGLASFLLFGGMASATTTWDLEPTFFGYSYGPGLLTPGGPGADGIFGTADDPGPDGVLGTFDDPLPLGPTAVVGHLSGFTGGVFTRDDGTVVTANTVLHLKIDHGSKENLFNYIYSLINFGTATLDKWRSTNAELNMMIAPQLPLPPGDTAEAEFMDRGPPSDRMRWGGSWNPSTARVAPSLVPTPEPSTWLLLSSGLLWLASRRRA